VRSPASPLYGHHLGVSHRHRHLLGNVHRVHRPVCRDAHFRLLTSVEHLLEDRTAVRSNPRANLYHAAPTKNESHPACRRTGV
jgi:hypothetical protein